MLFNSFMATTAEASCPFGYDNEPQQRIPAGQNPTINGRVAPKGYYEAFEELDLDAVREDLKALFLDSQDYFPADYGNYGPLMVRFAWHSAGSYRIRDGRGGLDGGRFRFEPERSWDDNAQLDKAYRLLEPIKQKYGLGLSWGDLTVLAGDTAIESMGGPIVGFCGGRIDDSTGFWSERLGPGTEQEAAEPCDITKQPTGICPKSGSIRPGLIYVNPQGPLINGVRMVDPVLSAHSVREVFYRMGMDDTETVALVGGGHAFGKNHGACPLGPGNKPIVDPVNPYEGPCGAGFGPNTATSGFEGPWTTNPTQWDNEFFSNLLDWEWEEYTSPGGPQQWRIPAADNGPNAPDVTLTGEEHIVMLTADLALRYDPEYRPISERYQRDQGYLDEKFSEAWYKLMSRDMGPVTRCLGTNVPEAREFQNPLPACHDELADFGLVREKIKELLTTPKFITSGADVYYGETNYGPLFVRLAWRCAATHRVTDYTGGCDGSRIRLAPQKDWRINEGLDQALNLLDDIKDHFGPGLSWADLIVLAGTVSLEEAGAPALPFCGGRTDALRDGSAGVMPPVLNEDITNTLDDLQETALLLGVSPREFTALMGRRSVGQHNKQRGGFTGRSDSTPTTLDNGYYDTLLRETWEEFDVPTTDRKQYRAKDNDDVFILRSDFLLTHDPEFLAAAQDFSADNEMFLEEFAAAWTKVMQADRYDGPTGNLCEPYVSAAEKAKHESGCPLESVMVNPLSSPSSTPSDELTFSESTFVNVVVVMGIALIVSLIFNICSACSKCRNSGKPQQTMKGVQMSKDRRRKQDWMNDAQSDGDDQGPMFSPNMSPRTSSRV